MFEFACGEIDLLIRKYFKDLRNPDVVGLNNFFCHRFYYLHFYHKALQVKELLVLLCDTMADETFGLRSQTMYDTMQVRVFLANHYRSSIILTLMFNHVPVHLGDLLFFIGGSHAA